MAGATPGLAISCSRELVTPMSTEREKLVRDINGLKESVRLGWLETAAKPMTPAERLELRKSIDSLTVIILLGFDSAYLAARPERRNHSRYFGQWGPADLSNIAMLSAQNAEEGLLLVTRSSDINS
jgi:hypothetical protein